MLAGVQERMRKRPLVLNFSLAIKSFHNCPILGQYYSIKWFNENGRRKKEEDRPGVFIPRISGSERIHMDKIFSNCNCSLVCISLTTRRQFDHCLPNGTNHQKNTFLAQKPLAFLKHQIKRNM